jgi:hypothetical protein
MDFKAIISNLIGAYTRLLIICHHQNISENCAISALFIDIKEKCPVKQCRIKNNTDACIYR